MIKSVTIFLFMFIAVVKNYAAENRYLMYHINKDVQVQHHGKKEIARRGMFFTDGQSMVLKELADVMLIRYDGKSMLLNKPGIYSFQQVTKLFNTIKTNGVSAGFFSYVFEKFLNGGGQDNQQKVSAAVFRGNAAMRLPGDSSFLFSTAVTLEWKPEQKNIPYRVSIRINDYLFDTIPPHSNTTITLPSQLLNINKALLIEWSCLPAGSRQPQPAAFLYIIPALKDRATIQQQLKQLRTSYSKNKVLLHMLERELFEQWLNSYQLK